MIVVRNVFRLKFGKAKDAQALWKESIGLLGQKGFRDTRMLTDLTGPAYTLVLESSFPSVTDWDNSMKELGKSPEWGPWYQRFVPLVESSYREMFNVVE